MGIRLKLNPLKEVIAGKRLVVVDDSIVHGSAQRALIRMLRGTDAKEVHVCIAASPVKWPHFYDTDFTFPGELLANGVDENDIAADITTAAGADSLGFVSIDDMVITSEQAKIEVCCTCFDGKCPLRLSEGNPNAVTVERMQAAQVVGATMSN